MGYPDDPRSAKVWTGIVTDPVQGEGEAVPRTVSMAWRDVCDTEVGVIQIELGAGGGK